MPVVRIRALPQREPFDVTAVLAAVCGAVGEELRQPASGTWATWESLEPGRYSERGSAPLEQPRDTHPRLVTVLAFEDRPSEVVERVLVRVADVLARELRLEPGNVFVTYEEARSGCVYDGGSVVRRG